MKKKAFITIYVLLLLLVLSITISFLFNQNKNEIDFNEDLYHKKQALYISESVANLALKDSGLDNYKEKLYQSIKDKYDKLEDRDFVNVENYYPQVSYDGNNYNPKFSYIPSRNKLRLESQVSLGETQAKTIIEYEVKEKFDFFKEEPIKYDFKDVIKFKRLKLKEDPDTIDFDKEDKEKFYKFNDGLIIEEVDGNEEEHGSLVEEDSNEEVFDNKNKEKSDNDEGNIRQEPMDESSTKEKKIDFKGIMYIKGDLILKTDFSMEGLLILDGNIISIANDKDQNPKLSIKGQVISKKDMNIENLDYKYDKESYRYIKDIDNIFEIDLVNKRVY